MSCRPIYKNKVYNSIDEILAQSNNSPSRQITLTSNAKFLLSILQKVQPDFRIELFANINDKALVDWEKQLIRISEDGDFKDLSEELVHIFVEMLPDDLKTSLDKEVINTKIYGEVFETYKSDPEYINENGSPNIEKIKREAVGQLITNLLNGTPVSRIVPTSYIGKIKQLLDKFFAYIRGNIDPFQSAIEYINAGKLVGEIPKTGVMKSKVTIKEEGHVLSIVGTTFSSDSRLDKYEPIDLNNKDVFKVYIDQSTLVGMDAQNFLTYVAACIKTRNLSKLTKIVITGTTREDFFRRMNTYLMSNGIDTLKILNNGKPIFALEDFEKAFNAIETTTDSIASFRVEEAKLKAFGDRDHLIGKTIYADKPGKNTGFMKENSQLTARFAEVKTVQSINGMIKDLETVFKSQTTTDKDRNKLEKLLHALKLRVFVDGETLSKISGESFFDLSHPAMYRNAIKNLKGSQDLIEQVHNLIQYLVQLQSLTNTIKDYHLDPLYIEHNTDNPFYKNVNKLNNLLALRKFVIPWNKVISDIREFNGNADNELSILLNSISGNLTDIENLSNKLTRKEVTDLVQKRLEIFNQKINEEYAPKLAKLDELGMKEESESVKKEIENLKYSVEHSVKGESFVEKLFSGELGDLVGGVEQTNNFIFGGLASVSNSITVLSDQYLVNLSQAHDPVLATLGEHMDKVVNNAVISFNSAMEKRLAAQPLVAAAGGSIAVGEKLSVIEDRLVRVERRNFNKNVSYFLTELRPTAVFVNQYGSRENYDVIIDDVPIGLSETTNSIIGKVFTEHGAPAPNYRQGIKYQQLIDALDTLNEFSLVNEEEIDKEALTKAIEDLSTIKKDFEAEWFKSQYVEELQDLLSLRYIKDKQLRKDFSTYLDEYQKLVKDRESERNLLRYFTGTPESEQVIRESVASLSNAMYKMRTNDTPMGTMLDDYLSKRDSYRESKNNYSLLFNKIAQLAENGGTSAYMKEKFGQLIKVWNPDKPEKFLKKLISLHLETSDPSHLANSEASVADIHELNDFLDDVLYYKESKEFYDDKSFITDQLSEIEFILNPSKFYIQVGTQVSGELLGRTMTRDEIDTFDSFLDDDGNFVLPIYTNLSTAREKAIGRYLYSFNFPVGTGFKRAYVLMDGKNPVKLKGDNSSEAYTEISEITKKYRDGNLNQVNLSLEDQKRVTALTQIIENNRDLDPSTFKFVSKENLKAINKRKVALFQDLDSITSKYFRENYYSEFKKVLTDYNAVSDPLLKRLLSFSKTFSYFRINVIKELREESMELFRLLDNFETNEDLNEQDKAVLTWIKNNHAKSTRKVKEKGVDGYFYLDILVPARNHNKVTPRLENFDRHFTASLSGTYQEMVYKDFAIEKNYKDTRNRRLQKKIQPSEATKKYEELTPELRKIYDLMVIGVHLEEQKKTSAFVGKESYLWYDMPTLYKRSAELGITERIYKFLGKIQGKINPLEEGTLGMELIEDNPSAQEEEEKDKNRSLVNKIYAWFESIRHRLPGNIEKLGKKDKHENFFDRKVPVDFTNKMDGNNVSMDFMSSITDYGLSLNKAYHYSENIALIEGTIESIDDVKATGTSKRRVRLEKYLEQIVFRREIGSKNFLSSFFRLIRSSIVWGSQTIFNPAGGVKNVIQGFIANYMFTPPNAKYGWKPRPADTTKTLEWFSKIAKDRKDLKREESLESFLVRRVNPNNAYISELLSSDIHLKDFFYSGKWAMSLQDGGERLITYQLMISTFNSIMLTTEPGNSDTQIQFLDAWENKNGKWVLKEVYDANGNRVTEEIFADVKRYINNFKFNTTGHGEKGVFLNNEIGKNLFFFMSFLVPTMLNGFTNNRRNFIENRVTENLHKAFLKHLAGLAFSRPLTGVKHWELMTHGQKRDFLKGVVLYSSMIILWVIIRGLFSYDPDDEDKMAELDTMSQTEAWMVLVASRVMSELESQSFISFTSAHHLPIITQNQNILSQPMLIGRVKKLWDLTENMLSGETYKQNNKALEIEEGDYKFIRELQSFVPFNPFHKYNPDLDPVQTLRNMEGGKNR